MTEEERLIEEQMAKAFEAELGNFSDSAMVAQPPDRNSPPAVEPAAFKSFEKEGEKSDRDKRLDLIYDLNLPVSIELGRTNLPIREILDLQRGSIVEFEKLASEPVDIIINGKKMAEGEVVVIEKHFGIRITSLVDHTERMKGIGK